MLHIVRKSVLAASLAALAIGGALSVATPALARDGYHGGGEYRGRGDGYRGGYYRGGYRGGYYRGGYYRGGYDGWDALDAGLVGLAVGAAIASDYPYYDDPPPPYYAGGYYYAPPPYPYPVYTYYPDGWRWHPPYRGYYYGWRR